ncbi:MAG: Tim44 domain-containing protein [Ottowia sp.]
MNLTALLPRRLNAPRLGALTLSFALLAAFSLEAEARRLGGGRAAGRQSDAVIQREATRQPPASPRQNNPQNAQQTPQRQGAAAQAGQPPRRSMMGGLLGGLAAGLGLAWLANALGLGEGFANVLLIALLVMGGLALFRLLRRSAPQPGLAGAGMARNSYNPAKVGNDASARPWEQPDAVSPQGAAAGGSIIGSALGGGAADNLSGPQGWGIPPGFDVAGFTESARRNFTLLQAAWDEGNEANLRALMTDEMLAQTLADLKQRGSARSQTFVNVLDARLLGIEELPDHYMASVEFDGLITEDGDGPTPFREVWNMLRPKTGPGGWLVAGIQPLNVQ